MGEKIIQRIFVSEETNTRNNFLWNTIGTGMLSSLRGRKICDMMKKDFREAERAEEIYEKFK